jgi:spoIIIJ-associated protein
LLERGGELLRSIEFLALEMLRLPGNEHEKVCFDCMNHRGMRLEELRLAAGVAAERVRKSGAPYEFAPMSSRERRIVHLALRDHADLRTQSEGEGLRRYVVVYPQNYKAAASKPPLRRGP